MPAVTTTGRDFAIVPVEFSVDLVEMYMNSAASAVFFMSVSPDFSFVSGENYAEKWITKLCNFKFVISLVSRCRLKNSRLFL